MAGSSRKKKNKPQNTLKHWVAFLVLVLLLTGTTYAVTRQLGVHWPVDQYVLQAYDAAKGLIEQGLSKATSILNNSGNTTPTEQKTPPAEEKSNDTDKVAKVSKPLTPPASKALETGEIKVFFAPAAESSKDGIDDHFIAFLQSADESIDAAFYELDFQTAADALIVEHKAGVKVRLLTDGEYKDEPALQACVVAGIPVVWDERGAFMHNKFCVVDDEEVWTGSTNITTNCMFRNNNNSLQIVSEALAENYTVEFEEMFAGHAFGKQSVRAMPFPTVKIGNTSLQCFFSPDDGVEAAIVKVLDGAKERIDFAAFSFTSVPIAEHMAARMKAGVKVRGLFEKRNAGSRYSRDDYLAEHGAQIKLDTNPNTMHDKFIVVDAETVISGSYNFSKNAEESNDENCLILRDPKIAGIYLENLDAMIGGK